MSDLVGNPENRFSRDGVNLASMGITVFMEKKKFRIVEPE